MSRSTANRLIAILMVLVILMGAALLILQRKQAISPSTDIIAQPTTMAATMTPATPAMPTASLTPLPTVTPPIQLVASPTAVLPIVTAAPTTPAFTNHTVQSGETVTSISELHNVSIDAIVSANNLISPDSLAVGQILRIPLSTPPVSTHQPSIQPTQPTITPTQSTEQTTAVPPNPSSAILQPAWPPSLIGDEVADNYPSTRVTASGQITLHYQPGTYPDRQIETLAPTIDAIWADIQTQLGQPFASPIDLYLAGTLFSLNPALQGLTQSWQYRSFLLINGAFHSGEEQYIIAHELTHIAATHLFGSPSSTMLHEGLAVHLPQAYLTQQAGYLPHTQICAALLGTPEFVTAVQMQPFGYNAAGFGGHIRNFFHYNLAGCFVAYLLDTYGLEPFDAVYASGDYEGVYGRSLSQLDDEWQAWLTAIPITIDPQQLINSVHTVTLAYQEYLEASVGGVHANWEAYLHLNRARLAANQSQFDQANAELAAFYTLFKSP